MPPVILWFRRDLRLADHPALTEAARRAGAGGVVPLFVVDDALLGPSGPARAHVLARSLSALENSMGSALCVRSGDPVEEVPALYAELGARCVVVTADHAPYGSRRDEQVGVVLAERGVELVERSSNYAVEPGTIRSEKGAPLKVFGAFRRRWESIGPHTVLSVPEVDWAVAPSAVRIDSIPARAGTGRPRLFGDLPDGPPAELPPAGELAAGAALAAFGIEGARRYAERRDLLAVNGTSSLSVHLRFGSLHPRTVLDEVTGSDPGSSAFRAELCWRDFYADVLRRSPESVTTSLQPALRGLRWDTGAEAEERFRTWARGQTGIPLVDAAMRQLLATGWVHNRARMVAASFLVKHLHLDWRWGARWFMWRLTDGDLASNTHGWQWTAGTGTDAAPFHRVFSPVAQAERFDPEGTYIRRWIPELSGISAPEVFRPGGGVDPVRPTGYPAPLVDLGSERAEALARFAEARTAALSRR